MHVRVVRKPPANFGITKRRNHAAASLTPDIASDVDRTSIGMC